MSLGNATAARHQWAYYPRMAAEEALLFKTFDSCEDGSTPRFVFHTAFDDPTTPDDAPPRRSIEVRTVALWDLEPAAARDRFTAPVAGPLPQAPRRECLLRTPVTAPAKSKAPQV